MAVRLADLEIRITQPQINLLREENAYFLRGELPHPTLGDLWKGWLTITRIVVLLGAAALVIVVGGLLSEWVWDSPFATTIQGTVDNFEDGTVYYHYEIDGTRYDQAEQLRMYMSAFQNPGTPIDVVHLSFNPAASKLKMNIHQPPSLFLIIGAAVMIGALPVGMWIGMREQRRLMRTLEKAKYIIDGAIITSMSAQSGTNTYIYQSISLETGRRIGGSATIGRLSPLAGRIGKGSNVAILYADDKHHMIL